MNTNHPEKPFFDDIVGGYWICRTHCGAWPGRIPFKHQPDIWRVVAAVARRYETQLFITTHNEEWLEAVFGGDDTSDVALWRLERTQDGPELRQFGGKQIAIAVKTEGEIR